ncbi:MAG TPA: DEAD/DEAH box helicase [Pyrinomonadaceae bacterium]|jgi:ATP-dependent RNA helicase DeaD
MSKQTEENNEIGFDEFELKAEILKAVNELGYETPSPIQQKTIPLLLEGRDIIGQAQTGTGKTAAFALPVLENIEVKNADVQALVLTPTRELAIQVAEAFHSYAKHLGRVRVLPVYGGQSITQQIRHLKSGVQIVVGTPGRVMDHMRRETLDISDLKMVVLDEADEMLRMGFIEDVEWILSHTPANRQTALFSATMPREVRRIADNYLSEAVNVEIERKTLTVPTVEQFYLNVSERQKTDALTRLLETESAPGEAVLVFHRTKIGAADLADKLQARGYAAEPMHGDMSQSQREAVIKKLKNGKVEIVVATDVAARGLDVERIATVVNYDMPSDTESYVHRIGRTGRAGREGRTILFVTPRQQRMMRDIERYTKQKIEPIKLPSQADVAARRVELLKEKITTTLREQGLELYLSLVEDLAEETGQDIAEIAAAAVFLTVVDKPLEVNVEPESEQFSYAEEGMVRLFIDVGRRHHISPGDIVGAIANEADIPGKAIGAIDVNDRFTLVDVPGELAEQVLKKMQRSRIRKLNMNIRLASSKDAETSREDRFERGGRREREPARVRELEGERGFGREIDERRAAVYLKRSDLKGKKTKRKESKKPFPKRKKGKKR